MASAEVIVSHKHFPEPIALTLSRDLLVQAIQGRNPRARDKIIMLAKAKSAALHHPVVGYVSWTSLTLTETEESAKQPQGCGCECAGCDQGYHCHKQERDCYQ